MASERYCIDPRPKLMPRGYPSYPMPDILDNAQIELEECAEHLDESNQITNYTCDT
jgi:hypothetical protein